MVLEAVGMSYAARTFALRFARTPVYIYTYIHIFIRAGYPPARQPLRLCFGRGRGCQELRSL